MNSLPKSIFVGAAVGLTAGAIIFVFVNTNRKTNLPPTSTAENSVTVPSAKSEPTEADRRAAFLKSLSPDTAATLRKLQETILPLVDFRTTPLRDALAWLEQSSRTLDPTGVGVKFSVDLTLPSPIPGLDLPQRPDALLTLRLTNVPLMEALRYVTNLAGLRYRIDGAVVYIIPAG